MKKFISVILVVFYLVIFPVTSLLFFAQYATRTPDFLLNFFREQNVYTQTTEALASIPLEDFFPEDTVEIGEIEKSIEPFIKDVLRDVLPSFLETHVEGLVNEAYTLVDTPEQHIEDVDYRVDLATPLSLVFSSLEVHSNAYFASLPECTFSELIGSVLERDMLTMECVPIGVDRTLLAAEANSRITKIFEFVPEEISLQDLLLVEGSESDLSMRLESGNEVVDTIRNGKRLIIFFSYIGVALIVLILGVIGLLNRPLRGSMRWIGITVFIGAFPFFLVTLASLAVGIDDFAYVSLDTLPTPVLSLLNSLVMNLVSELRLVVVWFAGILTFISIGLMIGSAFLPDVDRTTQSEKNDLGKK